MEGVFWRGTGALVTRQRHEECVGLGVSNQEACTPTLILHSRAMTPLHFTPNFKSGQSRIFWKGVRADSGGGGRCGSVWKEQTGFFFLSWRMRSAPHHPSFSTNPQSAHAHLGGRRVLKARPPGLRHCAQQRTPRPVDLGEPLLSTTHPLSEPWPQWQQPRQNCSSSAGTSSACCCR